MKKYKVGFHYEQGSVIEVEAESAEAAEEAVLEWAANEAGLNNPNAFEQVAYKVQNLNVVHRDYLVSDIDEE
jgi:hypothetical protein